MSRIALVRDVSPSLERCELSFQQRVSIDLEKARQQHARYIETLTVLGCRVQALPPLPENPDAVFVEDAAVVVDEVAVITRPGAESRRAETESMAVCLAQYRRLAFLEEPATLDGGDVLRIGRRVYVGLSERSNRAGLEQLAVLLKPFGYTVEGVKLTGCLHLKTAVTLVATRRLLINPAWADMAAFRDVEFAEVDLAEPHAGNAVLVGEALVYPRSFPRTRARLERLGLEVHAVDMSETEKAEGGVTCCSLIFDAPG
ncbi:MAG TPA: arginine deiminase family protein [Gammaproteobacteria bacterium]|nr:arginine deiminase family protein [Gammaproteobacteria bacterium]